MVEPLGEGLISVFPDGLSPLFAPAAALPALLDIPVLGFVPIALPDVVPVAGDPVVVPLVAAPPVPEMTFDSHPAARVMRAKSELEVRSATRKSCMLGLLRKPGA